MKKISPKLKKEIREDPFYNVCCISGKKNTEHKIDWHHNLIYAGAQVNEKWCILPLETNIHRNIVKYKEICDWIMVNRATEFELNKYSKAVNYLTLKDKLNNKYGIYNESWKLL